MQLRMCTGFTIEVCQMILISLTFFEHTFTPPKVWCVISVSRFVDGMFTGWQLTSFKVTQCSVYSTIYSQQKSIYTTCAHWYWNFVSCIKSGCSFLNNVYHHFRITLVWHQYYYHKWWVHTTRNIYSKFIMWLGPLMNFHTEISTCGTAMIINHVLFSCMFGFAFLCTGLLLLVYVIVHQIYHKWQKVM